MPYFPSLPANAGPPTVFERYPDVYGAWATMSEALMNGASPLSRPDREVILAYAAGVAGCRFVAVAHAEVAYALGVEDGLVDLLLDDLDSAPVDGRTRALLAFVRKLALTPGDVTQGDADAVFAAGHDERALHDAIAVAARAAFMHRLVAGHGFAPLDRETAARHARKRVERGYVNLYRAFRRPDAGPPPT